MRHDGSTLESGIWSCDTGQWIPVFKAVNHNTDVKQKFIKLQAPTLARKCEI